MSAVALSEYIAEFSSSPLAHLESLAPWEITSKSESVVRALLDRLDLGDFDIANEIAVHRTCIVEAGAVLKGPLILGPHSFVASGAYLRGGCWVASHGIFGPGAELKSTFVFSGTKLAHFNFVGDSILGSDVNLEAGSIVCNARNERRDKEVRVRVGGRLLGTQCEKFGALVGDGSRIGANAVVAPGALIRRAHVVRRLALHDDEAPVEGNA